MQQQQLHIDQPLIFRLCIAQTLHSLVEWDECDIDNNAYQVTQSRNMEIGAYNFAVKEATRLKIAPRQWTNPKFVALYINRVRSLASNLSDNPRLLQSVCAGGNAVALADMTHQEMNPAQWDRLLQVNVVFIFFDFFSELT